MRSGVNSSDRSLLVRLDNGVDVQRFHDLKLTTLWSIHQRDERRKFYKWDLIVFLLPCSQSSYYYHNHSSGLLDYALRTSRIFVCGSRCDGELQRRQACHPHDPSVFKLMQYWVPGMLQRNRETKRHRGTLIFWELDVLEQ